MTNATKSSNIPDLNEFEKINLLAHVDDDTFESLCLANKEYYRICTNKFFKERLYEERTKVKFTNEVITFKEQNMSWYDFYIRLNSLLIKEKNIELANEYARRGMLMELKILSTKGILPKDSYTVARLGRLEVLKWMKENNLPIYLEDVPNLAARNGHLDMLNWLKENGLTLPDQYGANMAAKIGRLNVLKWMKENNLPLPNDDGVEWAYRNRNIHVLKWMRDNNFPLSNYWSDKLDHYISINYPMNYNLN